VRLVCFNNLSRLSEELLRAGGRRRLATGGGFSGPEAYSGYDEAIFDEVIPDTTWPLIFNAISDLGKARPDFLDRALIVEFQGVPPDIDAIAVGLRRLPQVKLNQMPGMADFTAWVTACEEGLTRGRGAFLEACKRNQAVVSTRQNPGAQRSRIKSLSSRRQGGGRDLVSTNGRDTGKIEAEDATI